MPIPLLNPNNLQIPQISNAKMSRLLYSAGILHQSSAASAAAAPPPLPLAVDSDIVVILAALLCALICVVGLALVARCAWLRRSTSSPAPPPNKGLKKKALRALAKETFRPSCHAKLAECPICLAEFAEGDEIRILPRCGHAFHAGCIDTWLGSHSSCPSCRTVLVVEAAPRGMRCQKCGASSAAAAAAAADGETGAKAMEDREDANRFLP